MNTVRALNKAHANKKAKNNKPLYHTITSTGTSGNNHMRTFYVEVASYTRPVERKTIDTRVNTGELVEFIDTNIMWDSKAEQTLEYVFDITIDDEGAPCITHVETRYPFTHIPMGKEQSIWKSNKPTSDGYDLPKEVQDIIPELCKYQNKWEAEVSITKFHDDKGGYKYVYDISGHMYEPYTPIDLTFSNNERLVEWWNAFKLKV